MHDTVDYNNLKFEYVGSKEDKSFYKYRDSRELFNAIKNNQTKFSGVENKQDNFLKKLGNIKTANKNYGTKRSDS